MKKIKIEKIRDDVIGYDFRKAKKIGVTIENGDYKSFSKQAWSMGDDNKLYLNTSYEYYKVLKGIFSDFGKVSTEELIQFYKELDTVFPDDKDFSDVAKHSNPIEQKLVFTKLILKIDLYHRNRRIDNLQKLLSVCVR